MTLKADTTPGRSQMSYGKGLAVNPHSDFQSNRALVFPHTEDKRDLVTHYRAELRMDATVGDETVEEMLYSEGNPDAFGPGLPLVQEEPVRPRGSHPLPKLRYHVDRQP